MSNQNLWDKVDISFFNGLGFGPAPSLTIKKGLGTLYSGSWESFLRIMSSIAMLVGIFIIANPENFSIGNSHLRIIFLIGYLLIYGSNYGKTTITGWTEKFIQYTIIYFFTSFVFALGLMFFDKSGWWFWLGFVFLGLGIMCFCIAGSRWSEHKNLVYQFAWENLGNGQKFLIIQKGYDVMLYELKDTINEFEYEKIVQQKKTLKQASGQT